VVNELIEAHPVEARRGRDHHVGHAPHGGFGLEAPADLRSGTKPPVDAYARVGDGAGAVPPEPAAQLVGSGPDLLPGELLRAARRAGTEVGLTLFLQTTP
jgi:hypothetical protein